MSTLTRVVAVLQRRRRLAAEEGQALVLVLVFMIIFGVVVGLMLSEAQSTFVLNEATQTQGKLLYGADGGLQWAISQVGSTSAQCPSSIPSGGAGTASGVAVPGVSGVTVKCVQATGPGSNLYGGQYALVTGVGYAATNGANEGSTTCQSISADPIGGGAATFAKTNGSPTCLTYPSGSGPAPPVWSDDTTGSSPAPSQQLNGVWAVDNSDIFAVGNAAGGKETIWYFDSDEFNNLTTTSNTAGVTNANLNSVWAADANHVWAVGNPQGATGTILYCSNNCTGEDSSGNPVTPVWALQTTPAGTPQLNDVYGTSAANLVAVGQHASGGLGTVLSYSSSTQSWASLGSLATGNDLFGAYATDTSHVWVVGQHGTVDYWNGSTWTSQIAAAGAPDLQAIGGTDSSHLWAVGNNFVMTCAAACTTAAAVWVRQTLPGGIGNLRGVSAGDANDVWVAGDKGVILYCSGASCASSPAPGWVSQVTPNTNNLRDVSALAPSNGSFSGQVFAAGDGGMVESYTPPTATSNVKAKISGGDVFNAGQVNFATPVQLAGANFTQYFSSSCPASAPSNLTVTDLNGNASPSYGWNCIHGTPASTIPANVRNIDEPFPTQFPTSGTQATYTTGDVNCPTFVYFTPGSYNGKISFNHNTTYFFESGLYYFGGGFSAFDNGNTPPDNLYVIGGMPSVGDNAAIAQGSPCWGDVQAAVAKGVAGGGISGGSGTGVDWILGSGSWMDVHTVHLELFTREGGAAWEGAQGLSIREVPPACANGQSPGYGPSCLTSTLAGLGYSPSTGGGGAAQLFQVDASNHLPEIFVHGALYTPSHNIEEFTNAAAVTLGPIDCNSLELSFESTSSPALSIEAGTGNPQVALIATASAPGAAPFTEEALYGFPNQQATKPQILNWWVVTANRS